MDVGSSPRWRGARAGGDRVNRSVRIIPALAGSTRRWPCRASCGEDHPCVGGEHCAAAIEPGETYGSSPRWRGARSSGLRCDVVAGIIPALAGSTARVAPVPSAIRDHPRVGGEHAPLFSANQDALGSSPRWRGAPSEVLKGAEENGIIPALAGSTPTRSMRAACRTDHPRVGGEHGWGLGGEGGACGSSPRWRGARLVHGEDPQGLRIIPALAGSTILADHSPGPQTDHPRVGGEHRGNAYNLIHSFGSSPRWRGAPGANVPLRDDPGIIPALAGSTLTR